MCSTNAALAAAGYTTALSPSYGCKLILRDGAPIGHFDAVTAWDLPGMRREVAVSAAIAAHSVVRAKSRDLPPAERRAARRASSAACMAAIDQAHADYRAALAA